MRRYADHVKQNTTTTGTGAYTLGSVPAGGWIAVSAIPYLGTGDTVEGGVSNGTDWEVGTYTYQSDGTLARTTIRASSNADNAVSWAAGTKTLVVTMTAALARELVAPTMGAAQSKVSQALVNVRTQPIRVLLTGTSIGSFDDSPIRVAAANLQAHYGVNSTRVDFLGANDGTYDTDGSGRQKQVFGGSSYVRMAMKPADPPLTFVGNVDGFRLIYSKESDGGSFAVKIDGVTDATLSSNGTQVYEQVYEHLFDATGYHTITIDPPASGWAYLERIELLDNGPGVYIENGTMGAAGLHMTVDLYGNGFAGNKAGQAIVGMNGMNAWFNRTGATKPALILCEQFTNDPDTAQFKTLMDYGAEKTEAAAVPMVLVTEMPAMSFIETNGTLVPQKRELRELILSYGTRPHIAVVDWTAMWDYSNRTAYEARFFPNEDKTHATQEGSAPTHGAMSTLFGMKHPGVALSSATEGARFPNMLAQNPFTTDDLYGKRFPPLGSQKLDRSVYGGFVSVFGQARSTIDGRTMATVYASSTIPTSVDKSFADDINESTTVDRFGPYLELATDTAVGFVKPVTSPGADQIYTVVLLLRTRDGTATLRASNGGTNEKPILVLNGTEMDGSTDGLQVLSIPSGDAPTLHYYSLKCRSSDVADFEIKVGNAFLYGCWIVEGSVPMVTSRHDSHAAYGGLPVYMDAATDPAPQDVTVGQVYHTYDAAGVRPVVKKRPTGQPIFKPLENRYASLYECLNKTDSAVRFAELLPKTPMSDPVANTKAGGLLMGTVQDNSFEWAMGGPVNGQRATIAFRLFSDQVVIKLTNPSTSYNVALKADGTWEVSGGGWTGLGQFGGLSAAFTVTLPTSTMATSLGATPVLTITGWFSGDLFSPGSFVYGESACI